MNTRPTDTTTAGEDFPAFLENISAPAPAEPVAVQVTCLSISTLELYSFSLRAIVALLAALVTVAVVIALLPVLLIGGTLLFVGRGIWAAGRWLGRGKAIREGAAS